MTTRYFEYAVSEGEGTLVIHGVYTLEPDGDGLYSIAEEDFEDELLNPEHIQLSREISLLRYAEFITIHGSEVAI